MRTVKFVLSAAVVALLGLSWQAQRETNRRLDALAGAVAAAHPADPPASLPDVVAGPVTPAAARVPKELNKVPLPPYVVEAPDILTIDVQARDPKTGAVKPIPEVGGQHLVRPDGTIGLGAWGSVPVAGLTVGQVAATVREAVAPRLGGAEPVVAVDVVAYNSKRYYVVIEDGADGQQVYPFVCTGSDTVLDAVAQTGGVRTADGRPRNLWVSRTTPAGVPQILPVDWAGITQQGNTQTNYQLLPGDRLYVKAGR